MANKSSQSNGRLAAEIGAGLAVAGAAAAAGYYFYGTDKAQQHRKDAAKWAHDLKSDVLKEAKKLKSIDASDIAMIVDSATGAYHQLSSVDRTDVQNAADELKRNWALVRAEALSNGRASVRRVVAKVKAKAKAKKAVKMVKKMAKKPMKKTVKKAAAKAKKVVKKTVKKAAKKRR